MLANFWANFVKIGFDKRKCFLGGLYYAYSTLFPFPFVIIVVIITIDDALA